MSDDVRSFGLGMAEPVWGRVKWFDPSKGFGFIVFDEGGPDILLHANVLRAFGQSSVSDGSGIRVTVHETGRGLQAAAVLEIIPPEGESVPLFEEAADLCADDIAAIDLEPARVKWFDKAKGFGFANAFESSDDVFIHIEVLRRSGFADLQPGEAISIRIIEGRRGRMAVQVAPWEAVLWEEKV